MKKILFLTTLAYCFTVPIAAFATDGIAPQETVIEESATKESTVSQQEEAQLQGFIVRHQLADTKTSEGTQVKADPLVLLHTLKTDIAKFWEQNKPLNLKTTVTPIFSERLDKELKDAPALVLDTFISKEGKGKTEFDVPKYQHTVPEDENGGEVSIDWQGLEGQFSYPATFEQIKTDLTFSGLEITEKNAFSMKLGRLTFVADLDKDLLPIKMTSNLPLLVFEDEMSKLILADLALKTAVQKTASQVEISQGELSVGSVNLGIGGQTASELNLLKIKFGGEERNETVSFTSRLSIEKWKLSEAIIGEALILNHKIEAALDNLDAPATAQLQQTMRDLQNQLNNGKISEDILSFAMFGQLMQLAPDFLAKSPELNLSNIILNTDKGNLVGGLSLGINGQKAKSLKNMMELLMAMTMQADFKIAKPLLNLALAATLGSEGQAETRIKALLKDKTLVEKGDDYTLSAVIVDNKLTLNDQDMGAPMDLFMLLMPLSVN